MLEQLEAGPATPADEVVYVAQTANAREDAAAPHGSRPLKAAAAFSIASALAGKKLPAG